MAATKEILTEGGDGTNINFINNVDSNQTDPDPWTADQETALLKALIHYKPVGLHAHFRMISIRNYMVNSGTIDIDAPHTRIPGIWTKLRSLYDIEQLNENEDVIFTSLGDDDDEEEEDSKGSGADDHDNHRHRHRRRGGVDDNDDDESQRKNRNEPSLARSRKRSKNEERADGETWTSHSETTAKKRYWRDFELPRGDDDGGFEELIWERRLNPDGTPDGSDWDTRSRFYRGGGGGRGDTATDEPRLSPAARGTRSGRKGRVNQLRDDTMEVDSPSSGRASRRLSKAASEAEEEADEDHVMEDAEEDDDEDDEDESEEHEGEEEDKRGATTRRGRGGGRGRGRRGRRRK